eukprot:TRINITY_DN2476_c1_g2_i2.p2 TRINITY_DN2476_c1_g2~~TRINITY_DN2476_c1_g2_i2.p2  ORF type:complete len:123 (-),score=13.53 TRINITY_DN2476_c1_g2_i2:179-547(-)
MISVASTMSKTCQMPVSYTCNTRKTHQAFSIVHNQSTTFKHTELCNKLVVPIIATPIFGICSPALAIVDERMNGDGTGLIFGFNEPVLFWAVLGAFSLIWALYFISQADLGGDENDESGLSL